MPEFTQDTHLVCTSCMNAYMYLRKETLTAYRFVCPKCGTSRVIYKTAQYHHRVGFFRRSRKQP